MNPMLAPALPATPPGPVRSANTNASGRSDAAQGNGEFASRMEQALEAAAPEPKAAEPEAKPVEATPAAPTSDAPTPDATAPATAPDLSALLPGWGAPAPALPAAAETMPVAGDGEPLTPIAAQPAQAAAATTLSMSAALAADNAPGAATPSATALAQAVPTGADARQAPGEAHSAAAESALGATPMPLPAAPSLLAAAPRSAETAAPFSAHLAAAIDTPAFAPALATQVRWWAREGVQQAELTLNPPEMGPVTVKIVVFDGREARIDFSADLLATRSAIEAALPVLAAALDDSGLKLSGGGVHDGTAQHQLPWQAQGLSARSGRGAPGLDGDNAITAAAATRPGPGRGLVDLVA